MSAAPASGPSGDARRLLVALTVMLVAAGVLVAATVTRVSNDAAREAYIDTVLLSVADTREVITFVLADAINAQRAGDQAQADAAFTAVVRLNRNLRRLQPPAQVTDVHAQVLAIVDGMEREIHRAPTPAARLAAVARVQSALRAFGATIRARR